MILDKFKLDGKVAVVTGAGRGLGQGAALGFAEAGADLALVDILSTDETAAQVRALGRRVPAPPSAWPRPGTGRKRCSR